MKKNITNKKNRAGLLITAAALTLTAVFAAGTVSAGAVSINKATGYSQSVTSAKETLAMSIAKRVYAGHNLQQADYSEDVILVDGDRVYMDTRHLPPANTGSRSRQSKRSDLLRLQLDLHLRHPELRHQLQLQLLQASV